MRNVVAGWLGRAGLIVQEQEKNAALRVQLIIQSLGTSHQVRFFGLPASQGGGGFFGIATPELALWKRDRMEGNTRLYLNVFEAQSDRLVRSIGPFEGSAFLESYTAFFFIRWQESDMDKPLEDP